MPQPQNFKRTRVLVDPELQIGVSTYIVGWIYVYFLAFAVLANSPALYALVSADARDAAYVAALDQVRGFARYVILPLGLTFVAMAIHGIYITHRIAGPIVRFKRTMRDIAAHRLPAAITLRKKDHFKDLADEINSAMAALREDAVRRKKLSDEHVKAVRKLVESLEQAPDDLAAALTKAYAALDGAERLDRQLDLPASQSDASSPDAGGTVPLPDAEMPSLGAASDDDAAAPPAPPSAPVQAAPAPAASSDAAAPADAKKAQ